MADYIIKSPHRPGVNQTEIIGVNGVQTSYPLGSTVTLTQAEVDALNAAGYHPCELDSGVPVGANPAASLSNDAKDPAPTTLTLAAIAAAATTAVVTHDLPATPTAFSVVKIFRDRAGTVTTQDTEGFEASPQTVDISAAVAGDRYWIEATYGGSAKVTSNIVTVP